MEHPIIRNDASPLRLAFADTAQGALNWPLWSMMGWQDIRQRYRRSVLGPLWLTVSMAVLIVTLGYLFGRLWKIDAKDYLPFLTTGLIAWTLISSAMTEGCTAFIHAEGYIKNARLPLSSFVYRVMWRNLIICGHNVIAYVVVAAYFRVSPGWPVLLAIPGVAVICLNGIWVGLLLATISARFRDFPQIVLAATQPIFYVTPIIWKPELFSERVMLIDANPFYHFVELFRGPLLGTVPALLSWEIALATTAIGWLVTLTVFRQFRGSISFWI